MNKKLFYLSFILVLFGSALFFNNARAVAPSAISDLICTRDINAGSIWLQWTPPVGVSASEGESAYLVKYSQGNTIELGSALTYAQSWAAGTAGIAKHELATGFNIGTQFTFVMEAQDGSDNWSDISNSTTCVAPAGNNVDSIPPTTTINYPVYNASIAVGQGALTIRGISKDSGGSSVKQVEVSLDNGQAWNFADPVSNEEGNLIWQFIWQNPSVGSFTIKARATDWVGNVETPGLGIPINVVAVSATPTPTPTPIATPTPTPGAISGTVLTGADAIKAQIATLQMQLIQLLQQLIQLLQQR